MLGLNCVHSVFNTNVFNFLLSHDQVTTIKVYVEFLLESGCSVRIGSFTVVYTIDTRHKVKKE